eukprot:476249_1
MARFLRWYSSTYTKWPYGLAFLTCYIKGSGADIITQSCVENYQRSPNKNTNDYWFKRIDWSRNMKFAAWSGLYCGSIQHYLYNILYPSLFIGSSLKISIYKSIFDNFVIAPFLLMPIYFACKAFFLGDTFKTGFNNYTNDVWDIMKTYWKIWVPVVTLVFIFIPPNFRVVTVASVSFLWLIILSFLSPVTHQQLENMDMEKQ